jgi:hypothetical protein
VSALITGLADTRPYNLYQHLTGSGMRIGHLLDRQGAAGCVKDGCARQRHSDRASNAACAIRA